MPDEIDFTHPKASPHYEEWRAKNIALAAQIQSLYEDKVTVHFNETPSEVNFIITIGVIMDSQAITLLDFAKEQGII